MTSLWRWKQHYWVSRVTYGARNPPTLFVHWKPSKFWKNKSNWICFFLAVHYVFPSVVTCIFVVISGLSAVNTSLSFYIPATKKNIKYCFDSVTDIHHRFAVLENTFSSFDKRREPIFLLCITKKEVALLYVCLRPGAICVPIQPESIHPSIHPFDVSALVCNRQFLQSASHSPAGKPSRYGLMDGLG